MNNNTPGSYAGMTHAEAKTLQREIREQLLEQSRGDVAAEAQRFQPIHRRVVVIVLDDNDRSVSIGVNAHVGADVQTEFTHRIDAGPSAASVGYLAGRVIALAKEHQRGAQHQ